MLEIFAQVVRDVATAVAHNWPYLAAAVVTASLVQVYVGTDRLARWLRARTWLAIVGAVALATLTPFCSCGTTAVVLGALASAVPWAPIVAFMVSSPLTSPSEYVMSTGLFGASFATTYFVAAIVIGLLAGATTHVLERAGRLTGQARMHAAPSPASTPAPAPAIPAPTAGAALTLSLVSVPSGTGSCCGEEPPAPAEEGCGTGCGQTCGEPSPMPSRGHLLLNALWRNTRTIAVYFLTFGAIGFLIIHLIPTRTLSTYLGDGSFWSVPLAATLGVPMYISSEGSLPLVASLVHGGMGPGAALAFLITGAGTSLGAIGGMLAIARRRVVALVVASLWVGAVLTGWLAPLWL